MSRRRMRRKRRPMTKRGSKRSFRNTARQVHKRNLARKLHRGGYML